MFEKPIFFYDNLLKKHTVTVTTEDASYPKGNLFDDDINSLFKPTGSGDLTIRIDAGASVPVDIFCVGRVHNLATASATVALQHSATGAWAGEESNAFTPFDPATDNSYQHKTFTQVSARYWQVKFSGMSAIPQIGEIAFGERYDLQSYLSGGFDRERRIEGSVNIADGGQKETIIRHRRNAFPVNIESVRMNSQEETDLLAWRDAVEDGTPFWFLYDFTGGTYQAYFVSLSEMGHKAPYDMRGYRNFNFVFEEEL